MDASPKRTESMSREHIETCLKILRDHPAIATLDITGGAPELHPDFDYLVTSARRLGKHVIARHNLTVQIDGHPVTGESKGYLPRFYADEQVEVISSLPYYAEYFTDKQRGRGVFEKSITALRRLNDAGYGALDTGLQLNLVYNPVGAFLPGDQRELEAKYKEELRKKFGVVFNNLYVITNMPIHRFRAQLERLGQFEAYMERLANAFNPAAAENVMCRSLISVGWDGKIYDCDFNQMLELQVRGRGATLENFDYAALLKRRIIFGEHCYGCTAGSGSSCGGATA